MASKRKDNIFTNVMMAAVGSNRFDLSHDYKLSFKMGQLIPTAVIECIPGDHFNISVNNFLRFMPLISPVMHRVKVTTHYYFVPNRLLWSEWEDWITGNSDVEAPFVTLFNGNVQPETKSLADYIGVPSGISSYDHVKIKCSPMPFAAYLKIWDEYYRDQNLQPDEQFIPLVAGENTLYEPVLANEPLKRAWMHDYFTSCLPFAQKGDSVQIPLVTQGALPVEVANNTNPVKLRDAGSGHGNVSGALSSNSSSQLQAATGGVLAQIDPNGTLEVDVQADATDINTLRRAFRLQEWLEKNARGGTRYIESIKAHFGQQSSDSRLQRPEYIGGSSGSMVISEVLATADNENTNTPVGNMAGHGIHAGGSNVFSYHCEEHGFIIGLINVQPDTAYSQGIHRMFTRFDRLDYAWPTFANIGEQEVRNKEVYAAELAPGDDPEGIFGYIPRYSEYKYLNSRVAGEMRSTLSDWHLGRQFNSLPLLNEDFIACNPSTRIFAVTNPEDDHIVGHIFNNISALRKLPRYGVPTI